MSEPLRDRLEADLPAAMRARDRAAVSALRTALGAIANAEAVDASGSQAAGGLYANEVARQVLDGPAVEAIVVGIRDEFRTAAVEMAELDQDDHAMELEAKAAALDRYLGGETATIGEL